MVISDLGLIVAAPDQDQRANRTRQRRQKSEQDDMPFVTQAAWPDAAAHNRPSWSVAPGSTDRPGGLSYNPYLCNLR